MNNIVQFPTQIEFLVGNIITLLFNLINIFNIRSFLAEQTNQNNEIFYNFSKRKKFNFTTAAHTHLSSRRSSAFKSGATAEKMEGRKMENEWSEVTLFF